jgi:RNA polymerase sigma factor (sigma-70 family)
MNQEYPQFTREEERCLAERAAAGDAVAREQLILSQIPWAINLIVKRWKTPPAEKDELIAEAMLQLTKAVDSFDYRKGFKLSTWARYRLLHARSVHIRRKQRAHPPGDHVPLETIVTDPGVESRGLDAFFVVWAMNLVEEQWGSRDRRLCELRLQGLTLQEIGNELGISRERVRQIWKRNRIMFREALPGGRDVYMS